MYRASPRNPEPRPRLTLRLDPFLDLDLGWTSGLVVPSGLSVDYVETGAQASILISDDHGDEIAVVADLRSGEHVLTPGLPQDDPRLRLLRRLLRRRLDALADLPRDLRRRYEGGLREVAALTGADWKPYEAAQPDAD